MPAVKKGPTRYFSVINYTQVFDQPPPERPFELLRSYPTDLILLRLAKINTIIYLQPNILLQNMRVLAEGIFEGVDNLDQLVPSLMQFLDRKDHAVFSGPVMSLIIKDAMENFVPFTNANPQPDQFSLDFFRAILAYNEHFYERELNMETFAGLFSLGMQQQYYIRRDTFIKLPTLLKFAFISKFFTEDEVLKGPALEYCQALNIGTVWGLAQFIMNFFMVIYTADKNDRHVLDRNGANWPVLEQFVMRKSDLTSGNLSLHKEVIPKPLYEIDERHLILLDYNYFTYGLDQGLFYSIFQKTSLRDGNYNNYKADIGLKYFEQYYIGGFIRHIFSKWNHRVINTDKYQDYIVRTGTDVFVCEVKMTDFNAKGLDRSSFDDFRKFIDQNFLSFKQGQVKAKGLGQLIRQMGHLANDQELLDLLEVKDPRRLQVYPIIIYSDANLDMSGVNEYVNEAWGQHTGAYVNSFGSLRPVIMINGSFFMTYYYLLRHTPTLFAQWLSDYLKSVSNLKKRYKAQKKALHYMEYNRSFAEHMRRKAPETDFDRNLIALQTDFHLETKSS